ncbi:peptidylprolyl isomerase [Paracraurococcus ruber]|uniref:Peptidyl-prolyl cis-trans isomerase n=1 Tax=Paracraurococcus ruber TaxID=77675 RepID=A0ABS1CX48_9PROT|nr:peptidylprolyl isomerase [Paracraurococcus ruber]MBK1659111.1 peptidylprolyl isomerase [Paracraurococcus ruber]TDG29150.1 peptidylprolyl isomerase [Paracraurococcus ruber]
MSDEAGNPEKVPGEPPIEATAAETPATEAPAAEAAPAAAAPAEPDPKLENTLILELKDGPVTIELLPDLAPQHVDRIKTLARAGFYDNTPFHRVIEGFMAQGGDPTGTGTGGAREQGYEDLPAEFSPPGKARFVRGTCGMARTMNPNSANSQFFIMFAPAASLDGQYTIWGRVVAGMEAVDKIKRGTGGNGIVQGPDRLIKARIAADQPAG